MKIITIGLLLITNVLFAQSIKGLILDKESKKPLPYTNIVVLNHSQGTISNEVGNFSLDISNLEPSDSISFQYIGYKTINLSISQIDSILSNNNLSDSIVKIYLQEEIISLSEAFVFSNPPEAKDIIEQIIEHKKENYKQKTEEIEAFIRERNTSDINKINIKLKRNDIPKINERLMKIIEQKIPKHNTSYSDILGNIYFTEDMEDSIKIKPIKTVSLKGPETSELDQIEKIFGQLFKDTKENEYWKIKTGIFSTELSINNTDSISKDSTNKNTVQLKTQFLNDDLKNKLYFSTLENEDEWEFLYETDKYNYILTGGTRVNGEDVYIIDFTPKRNGLYIGRVYVSISTYALIRADYNFDIEKKGTNIHLLGVGYTHNYFAGSIFFEREDDTYNLKYLSRRNSTIVSFDRNLSLVKKRERFFIDKELYEIKVKFNISISSEESTEILVLNHQRIDKAKFNAFKQNKFYNIIYVDQFSSDLWKGYPIIEPTKRMKEYKKVEEL